MRLHEIGDQVRQLLLAVRGKPMEDGSAEPGKHCSIGWLVDVVCSAWLSSLACLSWCTKRAKGRIVRTEVGGKGESGEAASTKHSRLVAARGIACRRPVGRSTITWGVLRFIRDFELRKCLTVEGVRWISYCDFTTHPVKKWGFSLGLIRQTRRESKGRLPARSEWLLLKQK